MSHATFMGTACHWPVTNLHNAKFASTSSRQAASEEKMTPKIGLKHERLPAWTLKDTLFEKSRLKSSRL